MKHQENVNEKCGKLLEYFERDVQPSPVTESPPSTVGPFQLVRGLTFDQMVLMELIQVTGLDSNLLLPLVSVETRRSSKFFRWEDGGKWNKGHL